MSLVSWPYWDITSLGKKNITRNTHTVPTTENQDNLFMTLPFICCERAVINVGIFTNQTLQILSFLLMMRLKNLSHRHFNSFKTIPIHSTQQPISDFELRIFPKGQADLSHLKFMIYLEEKLQLLLTERSLLVVMKLSLMLQHYQAEFISINFRQNNIH